MDWSESDAAAGPGQSIFFAEADGPTGPWHNITSVPPPKPFRPDPRWYTSTSGMGRWDTIRVVPKHPVTAGWWGFITATPLQVANETPPLPPPPSPPPTPTTPCTVAEDFGCVRELNCGGVVAKRCLGGEMLGGGAAASRASCACACHQRGFTLAGLEKGDCFCDHGSALQPAKCEAVPATNASKVCTAGSGGGAIRSFWECFPFCDFPRKKPDVYTDKEHIACLLGDCAISAFRFSCSTRLPCAPPPPPPPPPQQAIRPGFALCESSNGYDWTALPSPVINFNPTPKNSNVEASGVQPLLGPDGKTRWYAFIGAAAWTSIGGRMGMFVYVAVRTAVCKCHLPCV